MKFAFRSRCRGWWKWAAIGVAVAGVPLAAPGEAMLQYFNASWNQIAEKVPELAEAGYTSLWLPPPAKANGGYSVGYDLTDPFDLGSTDYRGTWTTRYGTEAELQNLVELCHRFGIRVYFDNIMNHRAYDVPGYNESTAVDVYPGLVAEDFHLRRTSDGFCRKWDNCRDWSSEWQVMNLGLSDLIDIAHETPNDNFGTSEGDDHDKPWIVRHPDNPEFYDRMPNTNAPQSGWDPFDITGDTNANLYVGFGTNNGVTAEMIAQYPDFFKEDVGAYLCRNVRWMMDRTHADGFRLDAVKHVPWYFFGAWGDDSSSAGYCGNIQWQYNMTHGYSDWSNHRDTVFSEDNPRDDAMLFGEHLGSPPSLDGYIAAGMRLVDNPLRNTLSSAISSYSLSGYDAAGYGGLSADTGVMHCQSHDNTPVSYDRRPLEHAFHMLRDGVGLFYTDGNNHAATLSGSGGAFPRWADTAFLGQWADYRMPNLLQLNENFGRGWQKGIWSQSDFVAWERHDWRQGGSADADTATMLVLVNAGWDYGQALPSSALSNVSYAHTAGGDDAYLYQYADVPYIGWEEHFYTYASDLSTHLVPANSYYVFGWKNPDPSDLWPTNAITVYENGALAETMLLDREDGVDGDEAFNPNGLTDTNTTDYIYSIPIPRITKGTNVVFDARVDGSANNVLMRLDGGMDLNGETNALGDLRDNPPAIANDIFLGFEGVDFVQRIWPEKFAAADTARCQLGTEGATSYQVTIGSSDVTNYPSSVSNDYGTSYGELSWIYHNPRALSDGDGSSSAFGPVTYNNATTYGSYSTSGGGTYFIGDSEYNNNLGTNSIGLWSGDAGFAQYTADFPAALAAGQTNSFTYQHNWITTDKSLGWALMDASDRDVLQLIFVGGTSTYQLRGVGATNVTGIGWSSAGQSASIAFSSATNVVLTINGTSNFTWTLAAPATQIRFWSWQVGSTSNHNYYFNNIAVAGAFAGATNYVATNQYYLTSTSVVVWAKTPKVAGTVASLYYTTNGTDWPEGAGGAGALPSARAVNGTWKYNVDSTSNSWWQFQWPKPANGTVLRYKIGAAHRQGTDGSGTDWETVFPGSAFNVAKKKLMMGEWASDAQNLTTKSFHMHNDYNSWTTGGLPDGLHLLTIRAFLERDDRAAIYSTFRQTFYLDTETPQGELIYPATGETSVGGSEYGFVLKTDSSVRDVWYHIADINSDNDGAGNGLNTNGVVEWAQATGVTPWSTAMCQDTAYPKLWRFIYSRIPASNSATVRIRLREWSSSKTNTWSSSDPSADNPTNGHFTQIVRTLNTAGDPEEFFYDWPEADGTMVEAGWQLRVKYTARMASGLTDQEIFDRVKVYVNSTANGSTNRGELVDADELNFTHSWDWGSAGEGLNTLTFNMPNVYNGQDGWLYGVRVEYTNSNGYGTFNKAATRLVQHRGPLLPTILITTPPETDSDGAKYVIEMADVPASVIATNPTLRQTPIVLQTDAAATNTAIAFNNPPGYSATNALLDSIATNGGSKTWTYTWTVTNAGSYRFNAYVWADTNGTEFSAGTNSATRNATIEFQELASTSDTNDADWDDDGIVNTNENTGTALPATTDESWTQTQVFAYHSTGKSRDDSPDTDGDGLPDGLELGVRWPVSGTDTNGDTNGDGWKNFLPDLDPPFYNTLDNYGDMPDIDAAGTGATRNTRVQGSSTDPSNPDTDYDGIPDGVEDADHNGWVDGDGESLPTSYDPWYDRDWPDGVINSGETWTETSPEKADSDGDGLSDGYGEDKNYDGHIDGDTNSNRVWNAGEYWTETDPLNADTDDDGLPDGWEVRYGFDPLDNGTTNMETRAAGETVNGPNGNPDGDTYLDAYGQTNDYVNLLEYQNGTDPLADDSIENPGGEGAITIGQGAAIGTVNDTTFYREFMDWTLGDLIALDDYNQGGNSADIYRWGDGYDTSRDMMAFYFHDGGASAAGGDDKLYFRVDFDDLQAYAEESSLNVYVAINFGTYGEGGEVNLPDEVNAGSLMQWNACVGVYDSASGVLYVDDNPSSNTTDIGGDLSAAGVVSVDGGFQGAYFNSELDAVAWSIDRTALVAAGWNGDPDNLKFQVYTTRDFTGDSDGSGDKGGLNDFTDTIGDDWLCSDYYSDYDYIAANSYFTYCVGRISGGYVFNNLGQHATVAMLAHGNQADEAGYTIQNIVDNGSGAGYQRPVKIHNIYTNAALNLHVTPTLAMALEWAKVGNSNTWYSGPGLNEQIREGVAAGTFRLLGSTFSDHILKYFDAEFNRENVELSMDILNEIYGGSTTSGVVSTNVFWIPERVADAATLKQVKTNLGFRATVLDQTPHLLDWFGREEALGDDAYKINRLWLENPGGDWPSIDTFVIATAANDYRYENSDSGLPTDMRELFNRRARAGGDQISTIFYMWEDLADNDNADAYDLNLRWMANHPWIKIVAMDDVLDGDAVERNVALTNGVQAQDWVHHACNEDYDNWYYGSDRHESLAAKVYEVRLGTNLPSGTPYGTMTNGLLSNAWATVRSIANADVKRLAQQTLFASVFETAFHSEDNSDLSRWSYGEYIDPASDWEGLVGFAWKAHGQTRMAALYSAVDAWAVSTTGLQVATADVDLDGENEYILRNNTVMALFERSGGRMVGAWWKDGSNVVQMIGNFVSMPDSGTEEEGADNFSAGDVGAHRTAALKDWWDGSTNHVRDLYTVVTGANSVTFSNAGIAKTITLASASTNVFAVSYAMPSKTLYVRNGLSPDLDALLRTGQRNLAEKTNGSISVAMSTIRPSSGLDSTVELVVATGSINTAATDMSNTWNTVDMRDQAQTRQVELVGTGTLAFTLALTTSTSASNEPPVLEFTPEGPYVMPVGATSSFTVAAIDYDSPSTSLSATNLPTGGVHVATFSESTGIFTWQVTSLSQGGRTNDQVYTNTTFTADDGNSTTSAAVVITVPWDADADGMSDDWEILKFGSTTNTASGDWDEDGFPNYSEWVANTDPDAPGSYIGWESRMVISNNSVRLTFQSISGCTYHIQAFDDVLTATGVEWSNLVTLVATSTNTTWTDTNALPDIRNYRIKIPFSQP